MSKSAKIIWRFVWAIATSVFIIFEDVPDGLTNLIKANKQKKQKTFFSSRKIILEKDL